MKIKRGVSDRRNDDRKFREAQIRGSQDHTKSPNGMTNGHAQANGNPPTPAGEYCRIPIEQIRPSAINARKAFDPEKLKELAASIAAKGVLEPLLVRVHQSQLKNPSKGLQGLIEIDGYELIAGERRFRAAKEAGLIEVPCLVRSLSDLEALEIQVIENEQRQDLTPLERAAGYQTLLDVHGLTVDQVAAKVGKAPNTIRGLVKLMILPEIARVAVDCGYLEPTTAELIARIPGDAAREDFALKVLIGRTYGEVTTKQVRKAIANRGVSDGNCVGPLTLQLARELARKRYMVSLAGAPFDRQALDLVPGARTCEECPKRTGNDPEQYPDARADVCTDPACYQAKVKAHGAKLIERAKAAGKTILPREQCKTIFDRAGDVAFDSGYVDLAEKCWDSGGKTWSALIGKRLADQVVLAVDPQGRVHELAPKSAAQKTVRGQSSKGKTEDKKRATAERKKAAIQAEAALRANAAIAEAIEVLVPLQWPERASALLRGLALGMIEISWSDACRGVAKRRGLETKNPAESIGALIETIDHPAELLGLIAELVAAKKTLDWKSPCYFNQQRVKGFFEAFDLKRSDLVKQVEAEQKQSAAKGSGKTAAITAPSRPERNGKGPKPAHAQPVGQCRPVR